MDKPTLPPGTDLRAALPVVTPGFVLLFSVSLVKRTGELEVDSCTDSFAHDASILPFTAEQLATYRTLRAETEAHVLGVPFLAAERQRHWPVGRIALEMHSTTPGIPNVADVHLYTHLAGVALWEVWLPAPCQELDVSRWIAWLDDDTPEWLPASVWRVLKPLNRALGGSDHYRQYLPCCALRLADQTLDVFLDAFSSDIVQLLWRDLINPGAEAGGGGN